jgi:hypothetical protein
MSRRSRGKPFKKQGRDIYEGLPTDAQYKRTAHKRAVGRTIRVWAIRLLVVAAIALAWHLFGDDVRGMMRAQAHETTQEFQQVGNNIKEGRDRRAGKGWVEGE